MGPGLLAPSHIIMLALVALLIFGPKRLPEIARSLGHGMREFKDSVTGDHRDDASPDLLSLSSSAPSVVEVADTTRIATGADASRVREHDTV
jgi:sec-independent protein translocase protein TatA